LGVLGLGLERRLGPLLRLRLARRLSLLLSRWLGLRVLRVEPPPRLIRFKIMLRVCRKKLLDTTQGNAVDSVPL
jgi:hypothetical protein